MSHRKMRVLAASAKRYFSNVVADRHSLATAFRNLTRVAFGEKYLIYSNIGISISLSALGDYLEQRYEIYTGDIPEWDGARTAHMGFSGMTVGFICHHWYKFLDRRVPGRTLATIAKKVLADQLVCSPVVIASFFASVALFEDVSMEEFRAELRHKFMRLYRAEWVVWPPAQIVNFYFLPTRFRVLYDNTISLGYDVFTSQVKHAKIEQRQPPPASSIVAEESGEDRARPPTTTTDSNSNKGDKESVRISEIGNANKSGILNVS